MSRGQISFEYLFILGFAFVLIAGAVTIFSAYSRTTGAEVSSGQAEGLGRDIKIMADKVHALGSDSWATLELNIPHGVTNISVLNQEELVITYNTQEGKSEVVIFFDYTIYARNDVLSDTIRPGLMRLRVRNYGLNVTMSEVT